MKDREKVDFTEFKGLKFNLSSFIRGIDRAVITAKEFCKSREDELFMEAVGDHVRMMLLAETLECPDMDASELPNFVIACIQLGGARLLESKVRAQMLVAFSRELFIDYNRRAINGEFGCA